MNKLKTKIWFIVPLCSIIVACGPGNTVDVQDIPEIRSILEEASTNKQKAENAQAENIELSNELLEYKKQVQDLNERIESLTLQRENKNFWTDIESTIDELGFAGFFSSSEENSYAFIRYLFRYQDAYRDGRRSPAVVRPRFLEIAGQAEDSMAPWKLSDRLHDFFISFGKDPKMLLTLVDKYGAHFDKLIPLERKIELKALIIHYTDLLDIAQTERFQQLAQEIINVENVYSNDQQKISNARKAIVSQFPRYTLQELQAANRHLTKNKDDWLELSKRVTKVLNL